MELRFSSFIFVVIYSWLLTTVVVVVAQSSSPSVSTTSSSNPSGVPPPPAQISFPTCGTNAMIAGIAGSGCGFSDSKCLCKAKTFKDAAQIRLAKSCTKPEDSALYLKFINTLCSGQPDYPLALKQTSLASLPLRPEIWSALGAAVLAAIGL